MPYVFSLLVLVAMVLAIVDIILRDQSQVKHLPKMGWLFLVILIPLLGTILWFVIGRERPERPVRRAPQFAPWASEPSPPVRPPIRDETRSTEQQLADLEREIEEERLRAELARRRSEQGGAQQGREEA